MFQISAPSSFSGLSQSEGAICLAEMILDLSGSNGEREAEGLSPMGGTWAGTCFCHQEDRRRGAKRLVSHLSL